MSTNQQSPEDLTGSILQEGDFCIYTLNQWGGLNFGYVKQIKILDNGYGRKTIRIKMTHADRFGNITKEKAWDDASSQWVDVEKNQETWLNYTYAERFLITQPL